MASNASTLTNWDGWFKEVYSDRGIDQAIPSDVLLTQMVKFQGGNKKLGNKFHRPVRVRDEQGTTFMDGTDDALNAAISGQTEDAYIDSREILSRARLSYKVIGSASDAGSFGDVTADTVDSLKRSTHKKLEVSMLYGGTGIGEVASVSGNVVTMTAATWAPFIWVGAEGMAVDVYNGSSLVISTTVSAVDPENKAVTLADATGVLAGHDFFYKGAKGKECTGLHSILGNTGTLFGIDAASWSVWRGNTYSVGNKRLSYSHVASAVYMAQAKGLTGEVDCLVSLRTFQELLGDLAALRQIDQSYSRDVQYGHEKITFFSGNGRINIRASGLIKEGFAYIFKPSDYVRIGTTETTFQMPGVPGKFVLSLEEHAAVEFRCYSDQALFTTAPSRGVLITGIDNSSAT